MFALHQSCNIFLPLIISSFYFLPILGKGVWRITCNLFEGHKWESYNMIFHWTAFTKYCRSILNKFCCHLPVCFLLTFLYTTKNECSTTCFVEDTKIQVGYLDKLEDWNFRCVVSLYHWIYSGFNWGFEFKNQSNSILLIFYVFCCILIFQRKADEGSSIDAIVPEHSHRDNYSIGCNLCAEIFWHMSL